MSSLTKYCIILYDLMSDGRGKAKDFAPVICMVFDWLYSKQSQQKVCFSIIAPFWFESSKGNCWMKVEVGKIRKQVYSMTENMPRNWFEGKYSEQVSDKLLICLESLGKRNFKDVNNKAIVDIVWITDSKYPFENSTTLFHPPFDPLALPVAGSLKKFVNQKGLIVRIWAYHCASHLTMKEKEVWKQWENVLGANIFTLIEGKLQQPLPCTGKIAWRGAFWFGDGEGGCIPLKSFLLIYPDTMEAETCISSLVNDIQSFSVIQKMPLRFMLGYPHLIRWNMTLDLLCEDAIIFPAAQKFLSLFMNPDLESECLILRAKKKNSTSGEFQQPSFAVLHAEGGKLIVRFLQKIFWSPEVGFCLQQRYDELRYSDHISVPQDSGVILERLCRLPMYANVKDAFEENRHFIQKAEKVRGNSLKRRRGFRRSKSHPSTEVYTPQQSHTRLQDFSMCMTECLNTYEVPLLSNSHHPIATSSWKQRCELLVENLVRALPTKDSMPYSHTIHPSMVGEDQQLSGELSSLVYWPEEFFLSGHSKTTKKSLFDGSKGIQNKQHAQSSIPKHSFQGLDPPSIQKQKSLAEQVFEQAKKKEAEKRKMKRDIARKQKNRIGQRSNSTPALSGSKKTIKSLRQKAGLSKRRENLMVASIPKGLVHSKSLPESSAFMDMQNTVPKKEVDSACNHENKEPSHQAIPKESNIGGREQAHQDQILPFLIRNLCKECISSINQKFVLEDKDCLLDLFCETVHKASLPLIELRKQVGKQMGEEEIISHIKKNIHVTCEGLCLNR